MCGLKIGAWMGDRCMDRGWLCDMELYRQLIGFREYSKIIKSVCRVGQINGK